ncbi:MAG: Smr/MutS family protein [Bacteroidales bacterium]|nr:Smr/MutS family protein [Bacteroidales bacterium]
MTNERLEAKLGFDKIREIIAGKCKTDYASARVATEKFSTSKGTIRKRLLLTDEMRLVLMFEDNFPTTGYIDGLPFLEPLRKEGSSIDALGLAKLKTMLDTVRRVTGFFGSVKDGVYPNLKALSAPVLIFPEILRRIEGILDRYGDIKDSASDELFTIRRQLRDKEGAISRRASAILRQAQEAGIADAEASVAMRDGKYLIPVSTGSKRKISGFVYDESATGKTTYIEPSEIVELENEIIELRFSETREIARILREFTVFLRPYLAEVCESARFLGELDFIMAKAQTALDFIAGMPVISSDGNLSLRKARHPLLERALKREGKAIVPLTISLNPGKRILLISGPNAGGKSVCLKTAGLLQYMFQWGMLIPTSETSELPVFERIAVSIGDDQSLENDLSTYSSFLSDMREMLSEADEHTLVLIDEFGAGTEPAAGGAIAEAILAEIDRRGVWGVITTHYTNLKLYASGADTRVINGAMLYDSAKIAPMFALEIGLPGNSFAFELARKMRLPEAIVKDAEARAGEEFVGIERNLRKIARNRRQLDERLQKIKHTDKALEGLTEQYQQELEDIRRQRKDILDEARKEAEQIVRGAGAQVEKTIRVIKESQAEKEQTKAARAELQGFIGALQDHKTKQQKARDEYIDRKISKLEKRRKKEEASTAEPKVRTEPLKVGEKVRVKSNGLVGEVTRVSGKNVTISVGNISSTMKADTLERISSTEFREISRKVFKPARQHVDASITKRKLNFSPEIDIRGARLADALDIVTHFIDDAIMLSVGEVRIIHGKGTGVLHEEIQKYVRTIPGVARVSDEDIRIGGSGVTIVTLE